MDSDIEKIKEDISLYEKEIEALENVKKCSDVGPFAASYIDKHLAWLKKHVFCLTTKIDQYERD